MTCEEFAMAGLDLDGAAENGPLQEAARKHLRECPHCAALQEDWQALRADLRELGAETRDAEAPGRVEMRLLQEFRTRHKTLRVQRVAWLAGWSVATAAIIAGAITWAGWHRANKPELTRNQAPAIHSAPGADLSESGSGKSPVAVIRPKIQPKERAQASPASNDSGEFTMLPGTLPGSLEDATVVRVQLQRGALGAFGLPVSEERATDWIQVDLLVGDDGLPQAVRLQQSTSN